MAIAIYTDGGCSGNPGPGGWAYVMVHKTSQGNSIIEEKCGGEKNTTNNRMELLAVISALNAYKEKTNLPEQVKLPQQVIVHTDSQYVQKGITEWIKKWKKNSWKTSDKKPVKNQDLWLALDALNTEMSVDWQWVQGHAGDVYNERCDSMTQEAIVDILRA